MRRNTLILWTSFATIPMGMSGCLLDCGMINYYVLRPTDKGMGKMVMETTPLHTKWLGIELLRHNNQSLPHRHESNLKQNWKNGCVKIVRTKRMKHDSLWCSVLLSSMRKSASLFSCGSRVMPLSLDLETNSRDQGSCWLLTLTLWSQTSKVTSHKVMTLRGRF